MSSVCACGRGRPCRQKRRTCTLCEAEGRRERRSRARIIVTSPEKESATAEKHGKGYKEVVDELDLDITIDEDFVLDDGMQQRQGSPPLVSDGKLKKIALVSDIHVPDHNRLA